MEKNPESIEVLSSKKIFDGKILNLRLDTIMTKDGKLAQREVVEHRSAVVVIPIDDDENVILVKQYRHPVGLDLLEAPAGMVEDGEEPDAAAMRELREETGYASRNLRLLGGFWSSPGFTDEYLYGYLAKDLFNSRLPMDEDEEITLVRIPIRKVKKLIRVGEIQDAKTIALLLLAIHVFT